MTSDPDDVTRILAQIQSGDQNAATRLLPVLYDELRRLAAARMSSESPGQTLQATALVHEAYIRLSGGEQQQDWNSRGHFFGAAAEAMRRILIDNARKRRSLRRGGEKDRITLNEGDAVVEQNIDLLALDEALCQLEEHDEAAARLVKLRYFAGLTMAESAKSLGVSQRTAERNWTYAKSWLHAKLAEE